MSDQSGPAQTDSPADAVEPPAASVVYPPDYPFAPQYPQGRPPKSPLAIKDIEAPIVSDNKAQTRPFRWGIFAIAVAVCGFLNLSLAPVVENFDMPVVLIAVAYAALLSQLAAQSLWIVWSERPLWQRLVAGTLAGQMLLACFLAGIWMSEPRPSDFAEMVRVAVCSLPLVMLCVQAPLWALRIYTRWRIVPMHETNLLPERPLAIGDIIAATSVVALALALVRLASSDPEFYEEAWLGWTIAAPSIAGVSLLSLPPAMYLVLVRRWPFVGLLVWLGIATLVVVIALAVVAVIGGQQLRSEESTLLFFTVCGAGALSWVPLWATLACGYRLSLGSSAQGAA
jgi:hypothetical protein